MTDTTYETHKGGQIDLSNLTKAQRAFLDQAKTLVTADVPWAEFQNFYIKPDSPIWFVDGDPKAGKLERATVITEPLYLVLQDMDMRLGAKHGQLRLSHAGGARAGAGRKVKAPAEKAPQVIFSAAPHMAPDKIDARAKSLGFAGRSAYLRALIQGELDGRFQVAPEGG